MTDPTLMDGLRRLRDNLELYSANCLKIADKEGKTTPFVWNKAQRYVHERLEEQKAKTGKVRALVLKGRQQGMCLDPNTLVLTADLRWIPLRDIKVGQELVATDEHISSGKGAGTRRMRTAVVEHVWSSRRQAYRILFEDGRSVVCSAQHRWLSRKSNVQPKWRSIAGSPNSNNGLSGLRPGDEIRSVCETWDSPTLDDAWFGGVVDGEGSLDYVKRSGVDLAVSQRANKVWTRMVRHCDARGYKYCVVNDDGPRKTKHGRDPVHAISISNLPDVMRLVGLTRPERFIDTQFWTGKRLPNGGWQRIASIEPVGEMDLMDLQTTTGTFIAEGLVSHNSTYVAARFYHHTTMTPGRKALIVGHEQKSTDSLFGMVKRYHAHNPLGISTGATNAKELVFDKLDGGYKLATAGSDDVGRGNTAQVAHLSEFAFWRNAQKHLAGLGNTIADIAGTEIIIESTANGLGNAYHLMWQMAEAGKGDWIAIFVPWHWQDEYRAAVREDFEQSLSDEDKSYQAAYGLDLEQMQWRANKKATYGPGFEWLFEQEYPATPSEAFVTSTTNPLISPTLVMAAVNSAYREFQGPLLMGCDPAGDGTTDADRTAIAFRQGRICKRLEYHSGLDTMQIAGKLAEYHQQHKPAAIFVDKGGLGAGVFDRLKELGVPVIGVNSAAKANDAERFENKRAEMWWLMREWLADAPARIPNNMALVGDLTSPQPKLSSNGRRLLEKKEDMQKRGLRSPDGADALALTFAQPVASREAIEYRINRPTKPTGKAGY